MYIYHVHSESCVMRFINVKTRYSTYFSKIKKSHQFYPVKHISVFIDFKLGEFFFLLQFYLKLLCFLSCYWFTNWLTESAADRSREKPRKVVWWWRKEWIILWRSHRPLWPACWEKRSVKDWPMRRKSMNVFMKWMFLYNGLKLFWKHFK